MQAIQMTPEEVIAYTARAANAASYGETMQAPEGVNCFRFAAMLQHVRNNGTRHLNRENQITR